MLRWLCATTECVLGLRCTVLHGGDSGAGWWLRELFARRPARAPASCFVCAFLSFFSGLSVVKLGLANH